VAEGPGPGPDGNDKKFVVGVGGGGVFTVELKRKWLFSFLRQVKFYELVQSDLSRLSSPFCPAPDVLSQILYPICHVRSILPKLS
jgi:hypothetical protein